MRRRQGYRLLAFPLVVFCLLLAMVSGPVQLLAGEQQAGIVVFTDGDADHCYFKGDVISFRMGPFPCQAGKTDYFVFGIMEKGCNDFAVSAPPIEGLTGGAAGYYLPVTADTEGYFSVSGRINPEADSQLASGVLAVKIYSEDWRLLVNENTGAEAFIPVVATDGTPAIVIGQATSGQPADPDLTNSLVKAADNDDIDQVYFHGQPVTINFTIPGGGLPPSLPVGQLTITSGVFDSERNFSTTVPPLANPVITKVEGGLKIEATVNNPGNNTLPPGMLGVKLNLPFSPPGMDSIQQPMPVVSSLGKGCIVGVKVPPGMLVESDPPLSEIKNLYNTERTITFTKGGQGSITFAPGLNIIDNRDELAALDSGVNVNFDREKDTFVFEVKTGALSFLKGKSAGIKAFGVMQKLKIDGLSNDNVAQYINMAVVDESGARVPDDQTGNYIDRDNVSYDPATDTLTIPVKHFTSYEIGKKADEETPPDDTRFKNWQEAAWVKPVSWTPRITFNMAVDAATLGGISVWQKTSSGERRPVAVSPEVTADPKTVVVAHTAPWPTDGELTLYIDHTVCSKEGGKALKQPVKVMFSVAQ